MTDSMNRDELGALVKARNSSLQKVSSGLVRRTMQDAERLTSDLRILVSEHDGSFGSYIAKLTHEIARLSVTIRVIVPETIREDDLLETAERQRFDFAVLFLNNILYLSGNRAQGVADDSVALIKKMVKSFHRPLIGVYGGWPDSPDYPSRVLNAGATAVFRSPFDKKEMQSAIKRCLNNWQLNHQNLTNGCI